MPRGQKKRVIAEASLAGLMRGGRQSRWRPPRLLLGLRVLDTMRFGLLQRRRRVYLVASRKLDPRNVLLADETDAPRAPERTLRKPLGFYRTEGRSGVGLTVDGIPRLKVESSVGVPPAPAILFPDGEVLMPSLSACERLQRFPPGWTHASTRHPRRRVDWCGCGIRSGGTAGRPKVEVARQA